MKAAKLIEKATTYAGIRALGSALDGDTLDFGLAVLNSMLESWQEDNLFIPYVQDIVTTVTGSPVSIGTGQTINVARPRDIKDTSFIRFNGVDSPIKLVSEEEYNRIANKSLSSVYSWIGYYDKQYPVGHLYLYPAPTNSSLHIIVDAVLPQFADYTTDYNIGIGYQNAIELSLAELLCLGLRALPSGLEKQAMLARKVIRRNNVSIWPMELPNVVTNRFRNIRAS
jgi:hypothetical protein